jgi:hypothetical protein
MNHRFMKNNVCRKKTLSGGRTFVGGKEELIAMKKLHYISILPGKICTKDFRKLRQLFKVNGVMMRTNFTIIRIDSLISGNKCFFPAKFYV